jgi:hypothetical protein
VKDYVRATKLGSQEMFVPFTHAPGEAQADFGEAMVVIAGVERTAHFLAFDLPHSDDCFVQAFPAETTRTLWLAFASSWLTTCCGSFSTARFVVRQQQLDVYDTVVLAGRRLTQTGRFLRIFPFPRRAAVSSKKETRIKCLPFKTLVQSPFYR